MLRTTPQGPTVWMPVWVPARPLVEMTKLCRDHAGFVPVAVEAPVKAATNLAPDRTVGVSGIAPRAFGFHVIGRLERGAVVDVFMGKRGDVGMHAVLRAQEYVSGTKHRGWKTI